MKRQLWHSRSLQTRRLRARGPHARGLSRGGTVIVCVLACLVITSALIATTLQSVLRDRREVRFEQQLRQTELLCEAGVLRAARQFQLSSDYQGESWSPKLSDTAWDTAVVDIRVTRADDSADSASHQIEVVARLGSEATNIGTFQRSHRFTLTRSTPTR